MSFRSTTTAALLLAAVATARGQLSDLSLNQGVLQSDDNSLAGKESNSGVFVRDSAVALEKMALAQRMERLREWTKSADVYQEVMDKYRDRVVPSHTDDQGQIDQYTSVVSKVSEHLRAWPPEGLNVYRARYEVTAQNLVKTAKRGDLRPLHEAFTRYFVTQTGKQAGLTLIDAYFELGEFPAAAWIGRQLLTHPDLTAERPKVLFRVGLAEHLAGDEKAAHDTLDELKNKFPNAVGTVRGKDVQLADELAADLDSVKAVSYAAAGDSWLMPGGDPSRGKISPANTRPGARLYGVPLSQPNWKQVADVNQRRALQAQDASARDGGGALGVMPAVDRGELYFQDNARVYAVSLDSGVSLPGWAATYPGRNGQYALPNAWGMPAGHQFSVTLTDAAVLAVMNQPDPLAAMNGLANDRDVKLVCLDRATGKENWVAQTRTLPDNALKALSFGGSPLVVGDNVYVAARGAKGNGYEDCYVVCFDLSSGGYRWSCYVASAANAQAVMNPNTGQPGVTDASTPLSYANGRLYVSTNLGAVAALDAYNGTIAWLDIYREPDEAVNPNMMGMGMGFNGQAAAPQAPPSPPWAENACVVSGGNVFVLPSDGKYILVYDAGTGRVLKKLRKGECCKTLSDGAEGADASVSRPNTLLGVLPHATFKAGPRDETADLLIVGTPGRVCAIRWRDYDDAKPRAAIAWVSAPYRHDSAGATLRGRGFVTDESVYVPTAWALCRIRVYTGEIAETYPAGVDAAWADDEGPGTVLVSGDHLVIAGDQRVNVYTDFSVATAKLDRAIAETPADPDPRLRYAEVLFVAGKPDAAVARLDEALDLLGGLKSLRAGPARDRAFNDALTFATKTAHANPAAGALIDGLFDRAAAAASNPGQQVAWRMARSRFARFGPEQDLPTAVKLYQDILSDDALRTVPVPEGKTEPDAPADAAADPDAADSDADASAGMTQAGIAAESAIRSILQGPKGRDAYARYEDLARKRTDDAAAAQDPAALLAVATVYPNSAVAHEAMMKAAEAFEAKGLSRQATQVLRQIYLKLNDQSAPADRAAVLEAMARNYLKMPDRTDAAASRLTQAWQLLPDGSLLHPITLPDGTTLKDVSLAQARDAVRKFGGAAASANLPTFHFPARAAAKAYMAAHHKLLDPLAPDEGATVADVDRLLVPAADVSRPDRVAAWTHGAGLSLFASGSNKPLGVAPQVAEEPRGAAWVGGGKSLLAWTPWTLHLLGGDDAAAAWKLDVSSLPVLDVMAQATPDQPAVNLQGMANAPGGMILNNVRVGNMRGQLRLRGQMQVMVQGRTVLAGGAVAGQMPGAPVVLASDTSAPGGEAVTDVRPVGGVALFTTSAGRVAAVDVGTGGVLWQTRVASHAVDRLVADDDFTVLKTTDEGVVQLFVLDTYTGKLLARRAFSSDAGQVPVNLALADDGTLVYTMNDRVVIHDLYEAGHDRRLEKPKVETASPDAPLLFAGMAAPEQLVVHGGQVLAVCDGGKFVRGYSTETGRLREYKSVVDDEPQVVPMILATGGGAETALRLGGDYVFTWGPKCVSAYNLDRPDVSWSQPADGKAAPTQEMFLGKDYLLVLNEPAGMRDATPQAGGPEDGPGNAGGVNAPPDDFAADAHRATAPQPPAPQVQMGPSTVPPFRQPMQHGENSANHGKDAAALVFSPAAAVAPSCWIWAYSRALMPNKAVPTESGIWAYRREVRDPHGIFAWQPVEGGLYYLTGDHRLHLLKGVGEAGTTQPTTP